MNWKQYEDEIFEYFKNTYPSAQVSRDAHLTGRFSLVERQVDVLIEDSIAGFRLRIVVDAKFRGKRIDVTDVEAFIGYCLDIGASKGVLIAQNGYTPAAINRAHLDDTDIELDVLNFEELKQFQAFGAFPFAGDNGVFITAPFGWIIDGAQRTGAIATLYQRGYDLDKAGRAKEWMYINFWSKDEIAPNLQALLDYQESYLKADYPNAKISLMHGPKRATGETQIRCFEEPSYPSTEYTGFIEFDAFIFFCVLFTPRELANRNLRKLDHILRTAMQIHFSSDRT